MPVMNEVLSIMKKMFKAVTKLLFFLLIVIGILNVVIEALMPILEKRTYRQEAESYLLENLVAPATAVINTKCVIADEEYGNSIFIYGEVDSQNKFGALIRNDWFVEIKKEPREIIYFGLGKNERRHVENIAKCEK